MAANKTKPAGRPKGSKNKLTVVTEAYEKKLIKSAGGLMLKEVQAILETVAQRAKDGDMTAAKLILDRVIPARRASEELASSSNNIQINIVGVANGNQEIGQTGEHESGPTDWKVSASPGTGKVIAEYADPDGHQADPA